MTNTSVNFNLLKYLQSLDPNDQELVENAIEEITLLDPENDSKDIEMLKTEIIEDILDAISCGNCEILRMMLHILANTKNIIKLDPEDLVSITDELREVSLTQDKTSKQLEQHLNNAKKNKKTQQLQETHQRNIECLRDIAEQINKFLKMYDKNNSWTGHIVDR
jgi:hypothetical protein